MKIAIYGGSFNPPHLGHVRAAGTAWSQLRPDKFLIVPDNVPPHKDMDPNSPSAQQRLELCRLAFSAVPRAEISDIELRREGRSYTADTMEQLKMLYPEDELLLLMGTDMLLSFEQWFRFEYLLSACTLAVFSRNDGERESLERHIRYLSERYGARIILLDHEPLPMQSGDIRTLLPKREGRELLDEGVYETVIREGYYGALPELEWLRERSYEYLDPRRVPHVVGCESEAVRLAQHWGEDPEKAATAAILHDITKKLNFNEQLNLCREYGMICSTAELKHPRILHAITGAALAKGLFGISEEICGAIRWHTTGKPGMTLLEKIIYLADYIEPTRDFPGVEGPRELAYADIDRALALALANTLDELRQLNEEPFEETEKAYEYYDRRK